VQSGAIWIGTALAGSDYKADVSLRAFMRLIVFSMNTARKGKLSPMVSYLNSLAQRSSRWARKLVKLSNRRVTRPTRRHLLASRFAQASPGMATEDDVLKAIALPRKRIYELINKTLIEKDAGTQEAGLSAFILP
jgi:hypothetical protein